MLALIVTARSTHQLRAVGGVNSILAIGTSFELLVADTADCPPASGSFLCPYSQKAFLFGAAL